MSLAIPNGLDNTVERPGERAPLILGDTTYHDITEAVCQVAERKPSKGWIIGFLVAFALLQWFGICIAYLMYEGVGVWGNRSPVFWGWPIVNFVFLGRNRARRHIDQCDFVFVSARVANEYQSCCRGDDDFCGRVCGDVPRYSRRPSLVGVLVGSVPQFEPVDVAPIPQPVVVGRVRREHLRHRFLVVLVHGDGARLGDLPRSFQEQMASSGLRSLVAGLDRVLEALDAIRKGLRFVGRFCGSVGVVGAYDRVV